MRFLVDENVRRSVTTYLRDAEHDVRYISETDSALCDEDILRLSVTEERMLITNDKDFGDLVFYRGLPAHGIILFRLNDESAESFRIRLEQILSVYADRLVGHFVLVSERQIRIRPLVEEL